MSNKQTSIEWLIDQLIPKDQHDGIMDIINDAKERHKEESINDYCEGFKASSEGWNGEYGLTDLNNISEEIEAEEYYNKTYGKTS